MLGAEEGMEPDDLQCSRNTRPHKDGRGAAPDHPSCSQNAHDERNEMTPVLLPCSRSAHDQNVLARRPQWDQHGCPSKNEKQASLEGSFRRMRVARCALWRPHQPLRWIRVKSREITRLTRAVGDQAEPPNERGEGREKMTVCHQAREA
jgi:hypothetical protein